MSYVHVRGKKRAVCDQPLCGWSSDKLPDMVEAHLALAHHNYEKHPGVFPRWNPDIHAVEKQRGGKRNGNRFATATPPEEGEGEAQETDRQSQTEGDRDQGP